MARLAHVLAVVGLLAACRSFEFERQQVFLRYSPDTDVLDAVFVYEGVDVAGHDEKGAETLREIVAGRRHLMVFDWPLDVDFDKAVEELDASDDLARRFLAYEPSIRVLEARLMIDMTRRACLLQRLRVADASDGLRLADAAINRAMRRAFEVGDDELPSDPRTRERMRKRAEEEGSWIRFDGASLVASVPMTPEEGAALLRDLLEDESDSDRTLMRAFLGSSAAVSLDADGLRISVSPAADGWIALTHADRKRARPAPDRDEPLPDGVAQGELATEIARLKTMQ